MNKENSTANISGIILSNNKDESDVFCKVTHIGKASKSDQKWRLISAKNSKTAIVQAELRNLRFFIFFDDTDMMYF